MNSCSQRALSPRRCRRNRFDLSQQIGPANEHRLHSAIRGAFRRAIRSFNGLLLSTEKSGHYQDVSRSGGWRGQPAASFRAAASSRPTDIRASGSGSRYRLHRLVEFCRNPIAACAVENTRTAMTSAMAGFIRGENRQIESIRRGSLQGARVIGNVSGTGGAQGVGGGMGPEPGVVPPVPLWLVLDGGDKHQNLTFNWTFDGFSSAAVGQPVLAIGRGDPTSGSR